MEFYNNITNLLYYVSSVSFYTYWLSLHILVLLLKFDLRRILTMSHKEYEYGDVSVFDPCPFVFYTVPIVNKNNNYSLFLSFYL